MNKLIILIVIIVAVIIFGFLGANKLNKFDHHGMSDTFHNSEFKNDSELELIDTTDFIKVHTSLSNVDPFFTPRRIHELISFPCSNCHTQSLSELSRTSLDSTKNAHWNVQVVHASEEVMTCLTCHDQNKMDKLRSLSGVEIGYDESYKVCVQCHSDQFKDWQGGAHGKAEDGWQGIRISKTCVNCHNPHEPAFKPRWPSRLNKKVETEYLKMEEHDF